MFAPQTYQSGCECNKNLIFVTYGYMRWIEYVRACSVNKLLFIVYCFYVAKKYVHD